MIVYFIDITKIKEVESDLTIERKRLISAIRGTNIGTWEWNVATGETVFNERWAEILGYTLEELEPISIKTWENLVHPDDLKKSSSLLEQHFQRKSDYYECECRMKHKNGQWLWVLDRGAVTDWSKEGKPLFMYGTHQDITERKTAEIALAQSASNFRTFIEMLDDIVLISNNEGEIIYSNPSATLCLGYSPEDFKKMRILDLHPSNLQREAQLIIVDILAGKRKSCPLPLIDKNKCTVPVETRVSIGKWNGSDCLFGISKVIST